MPVTEKRIWPPSTKRPSPKARLGGSRERDPGAGSAALPEFIEKSPAAYFFSARLLLIVSSEENQPRVSRPSLIKTAASFRR
jgi:hypothetical protein